MQFQVIDREQLALDGEGEVIQPVQLDEGTAYGPNSWETGFKDTVISYPGEVTRVKAQFDREGLFVWHCHILEHEDNIEYQCLGTTWRAALAAFFSMSGAAHLALLLRFVSGW